VIKGPTILHQAAIKAAKKHKYKKQLDASPSQNVITVEVKFSRDRAVSPEIREVMPAGVGCLPVGQLMPDWFQLWLRQLPTQTVFPVLPSESGQ